MVLIIMTFGSCKTKKPVVEIQSAYNTPQEAEATDFSEQSTWLLGYFNPVRLSQIPYSEWYLKGLDEYKPQPEIMTKLNAAGKSDLTVTIVMGTWCPDSRREVPRFMKILNLWEFPGENITFIGVDNEKLSPVGGFEQLDIQRVPTFILMKNKVEKGRIIENPVTSLEQDLLDILTRNE